MQKIRQKLVRQQYLPHMSSQYGELRPQRMRSVWLFGTPKQISTGFSSWLRYCTAFEQWAPAKLCSIEQRALPSTYNRQGGRHVGHWPTFWFLLWSTDIITLGWMYWFVLVSQGIGLSAYLLVKKVLALISDCLLSCWLLSASFA